jgi:hypothetical protein
MPLLSFAFTTFNDVLPIGASSPKPSLKVKDISAKKFPERMRKEKWIAGMFSCNTCPVGHKEQSRTT